MAKSERAQESADVELHPAPAAEPEKEFPIEQLAKQRGLGSMEFTFVRQLRGLGIGRRMTASQFAKECDAALKHSVA